MQPASGLPHRRRESRETRDQQVGRRESISPVVNDQEITNEEFHCLTSVDDIICFLDGATPQPRAMRACARDGARPWPAWRAHTPRLPAGAAAPVTTRADGHLQRGKERALVGRVGCALTLQCRVGAGRCHLRKVLNGRLLNQRLVI